MDDEVESRCSIDYGDSDRDGDEKGDSGSEIDDEIDEEVSDPKGYLKRQFESFLREVDEEYQDRVQQTFEENIDHMVESLQTQLR